MAKSNVNKFGNIHKFLTEHHFETEKNVPDKLKCGKCKHILIDPCQGPCLCTFCRKCIDEMIINGIDQCPGNNDECKEEKLTNFVSHFALNYKISKLVLKCPEPMCLHECELVLMDDHSRLCSNRSVTCPFFGIGCNDERLIIDKIRDHLHEESYNHNRILIEMIGTLRNEFCESDERHKEEIRALKENVKIKDGAIARLQNEILIKMEKDNLKNESENKIANLAVQMKKVRLDGVNKWQDRQMNGPFALRINKISDKRQNGRESLSAIFYSKFHLYKIQLEISNNKNSDEITLKLRILPRDIDKFTIWSYQVSVTINIVNTAMSDDCKSVTQYGVIANPHFDRYNFSEPFKFSYAELLSAGLIQDDCLTIECCVE